MVHISLPHRKKDNNKSPALDLYPDQAQQRPNPSRLHSSQATITNGGEKPLILKVYVIRVRVSFSDFVVTDTDLRYRLETSLQKTKTGQVIRYGSQA
jgi:hypothetical protein